MPWLRMYDYLTLAPRKVENKRTLVECKDDSPTGHSLLIVADATHSGIVNGNLRWYRPDRMQEGCFTWIPKGQPAKPVLVDHNAKGPAIGRVLKAKYVDLSWKWADKFPFVKDTIFYVTDGRKRVGLYESIDWIVDRLQPLDEYQGLGYCELGLKITEPEAIRKVQADEYLTVSVGFQTDSAVCSICHTDWAVDDRCEHRLGQIVDDKQMFLITGRHEYDEVSFVNLPADPYAAVSKKGSLNDSLAMKMFFMGLPKKEQLSVLQMNDSLEVADVYESDIEVVEQEPVMPESKKLDLNAIATEIEAADLTKERGLEIQSELSKYTAVDGEKRLYRRVVSNLNSLIRLEGWDATPAPAPSKEQVEAEIETLDSCVRDMSPEDRDAYIKELTERAKAHGLELPAVKPAEAPKTDAAAETPSAAPAENAPAAAVETPSAEEAPSLMDRLLASKLIDAKPGEKAVRLMEQLDAAYSEADDDAKSLIRGAVWAQLETWSAGSTLQYYQQKLSGSDEKNVLLSREEHDRLIDATAAAEEGRKTAEANAESVRKRELVLVKSLRDTRATALVITQVLTGTKGFQGLSEEQLRKQIDLRAQRSLESLKDSLDDVLPQVAGLTVKGDSSEGKPQVEGVRPLSDEAEVTEPAGEEKSEVDADILARAAQFDDPKRKRAFIDYQMSLRKSSAQ